MDISVKVECYAGYRADERPLRFTLRGRVFEVCEVQDQWHSPGAVYFRVRTAEGDICILRHASPQDTWTLDALRAVHAGGGSLIPLRPAAHTADAAAGKALSRGDA